MRGKLSSDRIRQGAIGEQFNHGARIQNDHQRSSFVAQFADEESGRGLRRYGLSLPRTLQPFLHGRARFESHERLELQKLSGLLNDAWQR